MTIVYACLCMCICMCICMCMRMSCVCASMKDKPGLNNFFGESHWVSKCQVSFDLLLQPVASCRLFGHGWSLTHAIGIPTSDGECRSIKRLWIRISHLSKVFVPGQSDASVLTLEHGAKESTTSIRRAIHQNECNAATPSNPKYHLTSMKQFPSNKTSRLQSRTMPNHAQPSISTPNRDLLRKETYAPWAAKSWWGGLKEPPIRAGFSSAFFRSSSGKEKSMVKP